MYENVRLYNYVCVRIYSETCLSRGTAASKYVLSCGASISSKKRQPTINGKKKSEKVSQKINMNSFYAKKLKKLLMIEYFFFESFCLLDSIDYLRNSIHPS